MTTMRRFFTAVLEQGNSFDGDFQTDPYETGWASEARWFVRVLDNGGKATRIAFQTELSPDGIVWVADETAPVELAIPAQPLATFLRKDFGNWLRLNAKIAGNERPVKLVVYLALKE